MSSTVSAKILEQALGRERCELTVADAAARSGLPMREAAAALTVLASTHTGHVAATEKGELIYQFPDGLVRADRAGRLGRFGRAAGRLALGVGRFVVRAWVSVVVVGYALLFVGVLIAVALRSDDDGPGEALGGLLRMVFETLFWTFHPFSPLALGREPGWVRARRRRQPSMPFYERVNRFVFGVPEAAPDPRSLDRKVLAEIRRQKGRIVPADLIRITGDTREETERRLLRLVVDQGGEIDVTDGGEILYRFPELRATAAAAGTAVAVAADARGGAPQPVWAERISVPPLTGNGAGANALFVAVNSFNLVASGIAWHAGLTLDRLGELVIRIGAVDPTPLGPPDGVPLVLGAVPFLFSLTLFALPAVRALRRPAVVRRVARENGWRGLVRWLFGERSRALPAAPAASLPAGPTERHTPEALSEAWASAAGRPPDEHELGEAVRALGGTLELGDDGALTYDFGLVARERAAVLAERARASSDEASPGAVVFSSAEGADR